MLKEARKAVSLIVSLLMVVQLLPAFATSVGGASDPIHTEQTEKLMAYPGAEGYGSYSEGGRDGQVYHVTNLNADGEGSLTYGVEETSGARTIVFDVGGVIDLTNLERAININGENASNITIAGQTAPYPGITLKGYGINIDSAHDIILRHLKIRIGDVREDGELYTADPLTIAASKQVIVDHCSMQWAIDMGFRVTGENISLTNNIVDKSVMENSPHEKGGHSYGGMINEGSDKITFSKNFIGDSVQRSPRITDATNVDAYNNLLYNCGNGFDLYNYELMNKNVLTNIYNNYALMGPSLSNGTPFRVGRGRDYSGGIMTYFANNYVSSKGVTKLQPTISNNGSIKTVLNFNDANTSLGTEYDLSNVTLDQWNNNPLSYDNNNKKSPAGTLTYMSYPFTAPRANVMDVYDDTTLTSAHNNLINYAISNNGMGATKPSRDLYDTMMIKEMQAGGKYGTSLNVSMTEKEVSPFFEELEKRTNIDYSPYKTSRSWYVKQGEGPVLYGASSATGYTKPVDWDNYTDTNVNTNPNAKSKYATYHTTDFEVGDWWGQYCGSPGQNAEKNGYTAIKRTVADLYPSSWMLEDYPEIADFMNSYRNKNYSDKADYEQITWDSQGDGIPDWFKEYKGWNTSENVANTKNSLTGYTQIEEYLAFMADDKPLETETMSAKAQNFKANNIGYSTAQIFWNTDYRSSCVIDYGTEPEVYTNSKTVTYPNNTDGLDTYHAVTLTGLQAATTYYYKITVTDEFGNISVAKYNSEDADLSKMTFSTNDGPENWEKLLPDKPIITVVNTYEEMVNIQWTGNLETDLEYEIYYDTIDHGTDYELYSNKITNIDATTTNYEINGLTDGLTYYFVVVGVNQNGKTASDLTSKTTAGELFNYDFTTMTEEEKTDFINTMYMYVLGGNVSMATDPDTGYDCLQILDETNSHGVYIDFKLPYAVSQKFSFEIRMKNLYQKQTDALNAQKNVSGTANPEHNTMQLNFYKDALYNDNASLGTSNLWTQAFSTVFDSESTPITQVGNRIDGTTESGTMYFNSDIIKTYKPGTTISSNTIEPKILPEKTQYSSAVYKNKTLYGDALYSNIVDTDKKLHGIWYYEPYSAQYVTYKYEIDPENNNIKIYEDGNPIYEKGMFDQTVEAPYNVGKVQIKSRNDGYSWTNIESIKAYIGEDNPYPTSPPMPTITPYPTGSPLPTSTPEPTATATIDPNKPTATPEPTATATIDPNKPTATPKPTATATATPFPTVTPTHQPLGDPTYDFSNEPFATATRIYANTELGGLTVSNDSTLDNSTKIFTGSNHTYSRVLKLATSTLKFNVDGSCRLAIDASSANSSQNRVYEVFAGDTRLGTFTCIAGNTDTYYINYSGGATTISIKPVAGINVYGIYVQYDSSIPTSTPTSESKYPVNVTCSNKYGTIIADNGVITSDSVPSTKFKVNDLDLDNYIENETSVYHEGDTISLNDTYNTEDTDAIISFYDDVQWSSITIGNETNKCLKGMSNPTGYPPFSQSNKPSGNVFSIKACSNGYLTLKLYVYPGKQFKLYNNTTQEYLQEFVGEEESFYTFTFPCNENDEFYTWAVGSKIGLVSVEFSPSVIEATAGSTVTIQTIPVPGYTTAQIISDSDLEITKIDENKYSFIMPPNSVNISALFISATASDNIFEISSAEYNSDGNLEVKLNLNSSNEEEKATLVAVRYDENGLIKEIKPVSVSKSGTVIVDMQKSNTSTDIVKIFVWDELSSMIPKSLVYTVSK